MGVTPLAPQASASAANELAPGHLGGGCRLSLACVRDEQQGLGSLAGRWNLAASSSVASSSPGSALRPVAEDCAEPMLNETVVYGELGRHAG